MEEILNEQTQATAQTAGAEENKGAEKQAVSLGKFKDAESLLSAYNSLQSEFTKRCQRIKELEGKLAENESKATTQNTSEKTENEQVQAVEVGKKTVDKDDVLKEYLLDVLGKKPKAIVMDGAGAGVKTPVSRPKTIEEAGNLAKNLLVNN